MKKLFLVFLLLALPFQASWAAVAVYCQHQQDAKPRHFGHHEHKHDAAHQDGQPDGKSPLSVHGDCLGCHSAVAGMAFQAVTTEAGKQAVAPAVLDTRIGHSLSADRPEKPKWARAA